MITVEDEAWASGFLEQVCECIEVMTDVHYRFGYDEVEEHWAMDVYPQLMSMEGQATPVFDRIRVELGEVLELLQVETVTCTSERVLIVGQQGERQIWLELYFEPPENTPVTGKVMRDGSWLEVEPGGEVGPDPTLD